MAIKSYPSRPEVYRGFLLSLRFGQISPSSGDLPQPRIGMLSLITVSPVITAFHSCCLSHHVFDQVNLWPAWVGFETAIFWQCSPGTAETQRLYPLRHGPRRAIKDGFFGLINPYLVFQSRVRTEFLYLSLIGIILRWGFLIWDLIFIYCGLFFLILVVFFFVFFLLFLLSRWALSEDSGFKSYPSRPEVYLFLLSPRFGQISPLAFFRWFTATSGRNAESCNCIPSNYCLP